jgi:rhodanese-related sulfurtransferase
VKAPFSGQTKASASAGGEDEAFTWISVDEAKALLETGQAQLIDVREPWEYQSGHIPGACNVPLNTFLRQARAYVTGDGPMFVCAVGERSAVACEMAAALGIEQVRNIRGGTNGWRAKGYPLEK